METRHSVPIRCINVTTKVNQLLNGRLAEVVRYGEHQRSRHLLVYILDTNFSGAYQGD